MTSSLLLRYMPQLYYNVTIQFLRLRSMTQEIVQVKRFTSCMTHNNYNMTLSQLLRYIPQLYFMQL